MPLLRTGMKDGIQISWLSQKHTNSLLVGNMVTCSPNPRDSLEQMGTDDPRIQQSPTFFGKDKTLSSYVPVINI